MISVLNLNQELTPSRQRHAAEWQQQQEELSKSRQEYISGSPSLTASQPYRDAAVIRARHVTAKSVRIQFQG